MKTTMQTKARSLAGVTAGCVLLATALGPVTTPLHAAPVRVLILSGMNNHDWRATTPKLREILEATGRFQVSVTEHPEQLDAEALSEADVLLSNWNNFGAKADSPSARWPAATRAAYLDFVRQGGGHVTVHAGGSSFADWTEYRQVALASWKLGQTRHGPVHEFPVRIEAPDHPVTRGLKSFRERDELWVNPGIAPGARTLASAFADANHRAGSGRWEPIAVAGSWGSGRTFALLLGHDAGLMAQPGFRTLLTRGVEWAATGAVTVAPSPEVADPSGALAWRWSAGSVALLRDDQVVWAFRYGPAESKPSFHPVALANGPDLTWFRPPDHPWHRALWFSWKYINHVNYWEEDRKSGASAGRTVQGPPTIEPRADHSARITQDLTYRPAQGEPVMTEHRIVEISPPAADGSYHFDWDQRFTAVQDLVLDRTPLPHEPGGQVFGGYAGLSVRFAKALAERRGQTSVETPTWKQDRYRGKASGFDYTGVLAGREVGIAILDHPDNLNAPSPWYAINGALMHYFSPAVICYGPHAMKAGEKLRLRYRVVVHPGRWSAEQLRAAAAAFAGR